MQHPNATSSLVSRAFFISQLAAIGLYGVAAAIANFTANDFFLGVMMLAGVAAVMVFVLGLRLPSHFADRMSARALSVLAITVSLVLVGIALSSYTGFADLPADLADRTGVRSLRAVTVVGVGAFGLTLVLNIVVAAIASRSTQKASA